MKKMFKRTAAIAISAFMAAQYIPFSAVAKSNTTCDLYIHPYILNETDYGTAKSSTYNPTGTTGDEAHVPSATPAYAVATTMTFDIIQVAPDGSAYTDGTPASRTGVSAVAADSQTASTTDLPDGYYRITPHNNITETDANFNDAQAFIIQIPVSSTTGNVRDVHIYPKFTDNNDNDDPGTTDPGQETPTSGDTHNVTLTKTDNSNPAVAVQGATYKLYYKDAAGNWVAGASTYTTNESGQIVVTGLPLGKYYFVEQSAPIGYLLDKNPIAFTIDGATAATVNPVNDKNLTVKKEIAMDGKGKVYNWVITADVPSKPQNLLSYTITDTYDGLSTTATDITVSIAGMTEGAAQDYTVTKTQTDTNKGTIVITLTQAGIGKLSGTSFDINVSTKLGANAATATNSASINYQYAYDPTTDPENDSNDPVYDPDKDDIIDDADIPNPDPSDPTNPAYPKDYPTPSSGDPDPNNPYTEQVTPATITISNIGPDENNTDKELTGAFYISNCSEHHDDTAGEDEGTLNDSKLTIANLAPGKYEIYQTATEDGYIKDDVHQFIYIDKDGKVYEFNTDASPKGNEITDKTIVFRNTKKGGFSLPFTGTTATIVFSVTGLIIMAGTMFFFFVILKKRDDEEEEEQENN